MNPVLIVACVVLAVIQLRISRDWAFLPLIIAVCHTPYTPFLAGLTVTRVVLLVGIFRAVQEGCFRWSFKDTRDRLILLFAVVALISTFAHEWGRVNPLNERIRLVLDVVGTYLFARAFLVENKAIARLGIGLAFVMVPFAVMMAFQKATGFNPYSILGAPSFSLIRDGEFRAQGPFGTPILAGTAGASVIALLIPLWREWRKVAIMGTAASLIVVIASGSSGPIGTTVLSLGVVSLWRWRGNLRQIRVVAVIGLIIIHFVRTRPVWHLMSIIDIVGGSTGWHRAYLIDMAVAHLDEWWLLGCDYTNHWMPYALAAVPEHCDLTNYYIQLGVTGGLPLMICLVLSQWKAFRSLGGAFREIGGAGTEAEFRLWCVGSALFAHTITFLSISYFDQMSVFFWLLVGGLPGFISDSSGPAGEEPEDWDDEPTGPVVWADWAPGEHRDWQPSRDS
ncbi:MAG: O-antigen ligase family protein [Verrucomicrobiales bacterium]|nr:hypothetical protein [Verrucomicrobiota bacterium JB025]